VAKDDLEVQHIQDEFYRLWELGIVEELAEFNKNLDIVAENYKAQSLG
jgi:putative GTP pyrophosphokinase